LLFHSLFEFYYSFRLALPFCLLPVSIRLGWSRGHGGVDFL